MTDPGRARDVAGLIRQSDVDEVKARTNIADVIGDYVALKSAGVGSLKGLCPFHDERSPSFHVRPQVGFYHCFGCGESGDVYTFLQRMDHLGFAESVERLAARIGFQLSYEEGGPSSAERGSRVRMLAANTAAEEYFSSRLTSSQAEAGRRFLGRRGFDAEAARRFGVGFAPKSWDGLITHLRGRGFTDEEISGAGLASSGERGIYDRFRGRLIWPIRDVTGQTIGFGARKLSDDDTGPKYLNTPETAVYHKAQVLYGLDLAKRQISREHRVVIVEGYTDVMACHLAGIDTAVATCGTAFGSDHVSVLRRVLGDDSSAGEVIFTFDPDAAGQKAAVRAFGQSRRFAAQTYIAVGPEGLDPCDLRLNRGDAAVQRMVQEKKPMFEFMVRQAVAPFDLETVDGRVAALRAAAPVVAAMGDAALRHGYTRQLARILGMELTEVTSSVTAAARASARGEASVPARREPADPTSPEPSRPPVGWASLGVDPATRLERDAMQVLLQHPQSVGEELAGRAVRSGMTNPSLAVVRDAIAVELGSAGHSGWLERVLDAVPEPLRSLVHELAVAPIPERREREVDVYARGVITALIDKDLLHRRAQLMGRLQRCDPSDVDQVRTVQRELADVERERRRLKEE